MTLENVADTLGALNASLADAIEDLNVAEEKWDEERDQAFEDLKKDMDDTGRKGDPAEHAVVTLARRRNRDAYHAYRRAKREVQKLETISQNRRSELSGLQTAAREAT